MEMEEIESLIVKLSPHVSDSVLAEALGLTKDKVKDIRQRMGILKGDKAKQQNTPSKEELMRLEAEGLTCRQIAERLGITYDAYLYLRRKLGLPPRPRGRRKYNEQEVVERIRQFISQHGGRYRYADLTRMLGLDYMTIKRLLLKHGLPMPANRRRGEYSLFRHIISDDEIREAISTISHMYSLTPLSLSSSRSVEKTLRLLEELLRLRAARKLEVVGREPDGSKG
jgi:transposase